MKEKMKIIQVIPSLELGGAEIMVENLSITLKKMGIDSQIVSFYKLRSPITERLETQNIPVKFLGKKKGLDITMIYKLYKNFRIEKPDMIHTHLYTLPYVSAAAFFANIPIKLHTIHSIADQEVSSFRRKIHKLIFKYHQVIPVAISPQVKETILSEYKFKEDKVPMIFNGIDLSNCTTKQDYEIKKDGLNLLHIGSFKEAKNHITLIESFKKVNNSYPNSKLKLIGSGHLKEEIEEKIIELNLGENIELLGIKSNVYPYLEQADIFLLPSTWEGMPITIIEAMGVGVPIVATNVGGIPDMIIHNETGLLVNNDKDEISSAIMKLSKDLKLRKSLGQRAKEKSSKFSSVIMAKSYLTLYKN